MTVHNGLTLREKLHLAKTATSYSTVTWSQSKSTNQANHFKTKQDLQHMYPAEHLTNLESNSTQANPPRNLQLVLLVANK